MASANHTSNDAGNSESPATNNDYCIEREIWRIYAIVKGAQAIVNEKDAWKGSAEQCAVNTLLGDVQDQLTELADQVDEFNTEGALSKILEASHE